MKEPSSHKTSISIQTRWMNYQNKNLWHICFDYNCNLYRPILCWESINVTHWRFDFFQFFLWEQPLNVKTFYILHFSTGQLSEAQEKAKIKTSHHFPIQPLEVTLPKQKLEIFRRCQIDGNNISIQNYMVSKGSWKWFNVKNHF